MKRKNGIKLSDLINTKVGMANRAKIGDLWPSAADKKPKRNKYNAIKVVIDGIKFDSTGEGDRYQFLKEKKRIGVISDLRLQVRYELVPKYVEDGKTVRAMNYVADFVYINNKTGLEVVEDFKGRRTQSYKDKRKLMMKIHGISIYETNRQTLKDGVL